MRGKHVAYTILFLFGIFFLGLLGRTCNWANKAADVAAAQVDPATMLKKYEWFKDAAAQLDAKKSILVSYDQRLASIKATYGADSTNRSKWNRSDIDAYNLWQSEYLGVKASYNDVAAQYNAAMAKINYAFCNVGGVPPGASEPLPKDFKPYF